MQKEITMFMKIVYTNEPTDYDRVGCEGLYIKSCEPVTSHNSDYAKCCEDIEKLMMYRGEMPEQGQLVEILKKHFA